MLVIDAGALEPPVTVVLEGRFRRGAEESEPDCVDVVYATGEGDDTIVEVAATHGAWWSPPIAD